ncbi:MAG: hypothetical protein EOO65_00080 [Methanosarcinales archaeon]|nr:MAG: hypothetical protein EOO65_00080 [Methanosarcinales archaeon]
MTAAVMRTFCVCSRGCVCARVRLCLQGEGKLVGTSSLQVDPFTIAERINVLADANTPPILSHVAQAERMRFTFEAVWRSVVRHLMDVAVSEHTFFTHFFGEGQAAEMLMLTLSKTTMTLLASLEDHLLQSFDAPGMMLLVALTAEQRRIMEVERKCSDLGQFFDRVTLLLWPRFKTVLDANVASVRVARETGRKLGPVDSNAHIIAKRYAEFASSILCLHGRLSMHHLSDDMLPQHMSALAKDVDAMLQKLAADLPSRLAKVVFMVNNYGFMLSTGQARNLTPDAMGLWERAATHYMNMLSDAELETHFRALLAFTKKAEATAIANAAAANIPLITTAPADAAGVMQAPPTPGTISTVPDSVMLRLDVTESESVLREFNVTWRQGVKALHDDVVRYFQAGTAPSSTVVLKRIMTAFLNLYERFNTVLTRGLPTGTAALHEIVPIQTIYHEMKKYIAKVESGAGGVAGM